MIARQIVTKVTVSSGFRILKRLFQNNTHGSFRVVNVTKQSLKRQQNS